MNNKCNYNNIHFEMSFWYIAISGKIIPVSDRAQIRVKRYRGDS